MLNKVDKIYICHYSKLTDRVEVMKEQLSIYGLEAEWVTQFDKEDIDFNNIPLNYLTPMNIPGHHRNLKQSEISLLYKHQYILNDMKDKYSNVLVLEDDALFCDDFLNKFNEDMESLPDNFDIIWVGSCCNLHAKKKENKSFYKENGSRCTHGYMINIKCVDKVLEYMNINNYPCDFMYNKIIEKYNLENYWLEPDLISQNEKFNTSIQQ